MPAEGLREEPRMSETRMGRAPGCLSLLGGPLLAFGLWMIAQALLLPHEAETIRLSVITGVFAAGAGGYLLAQRMRSIFRRQAPAPGSAQVSQPAGDPAAQTVAESVADFLPGIGCFVICFGFLLVGPIFLWLYFSGAPTRRGNPVMGLVAGIVFTALGFLGILVLGSMRRKSGRRWGRKDPRRLP
jgi:hypothetical protein